MKISTLILSLIVLIGFKSYAQEIEEAPFDTLARSVSVLQSDVEGFKKLKFSGYIQAQYQYADTIGAASFAGGNFAANTQNRMTIRRGRIKATYSGDFSKFVLQVDVTEKGLGLKDAYMQYTLPFFNYVSFTGGVFDRPFGYEISYSSSQRESPERSMIFQTLFPGERDLGAKITFQPPKTSNFNFIKLDLGLFNGTGGQAVDFDSKKDFIGHLSLNKNSKNEKMSFGLGLSYYNGSNRLDTLGKANLYQNVGVRNDSVLYLDVNRVAAGDAGKRQFYGVDAQFAGDFAIGLTVIRAEYLFGSQLGTSSSTKTPTTDPKANAFLRNFNGGYVILAQNILKSKHQVILKYDWYDPNTDAAADNLGVKNTQLGKADLSYSTIGIGWVYRFDPNVKLTLYYDIVKNETSKNLSGATYDLKDNVFTARLQYKF